MLPDGAARIDEGGERADEGVEPLGRAEAREEPVAVVHRIEHALRGLLGQARHEEEVEAAAAQLQRVADEALQRRVVEGPAEGVAHLLVVALGADLDVELGHGFGHHLEKLSRRRVEELDDHLVFDPSRFISAKRSRA